MRKYIPSILTIIKEAREIGKYVSSKASGLLSERTRKVDIDGTTVKRLIVNYEDHLASIGKRETISPKKIAELNNKGKMPHMIKHCVVAVQPTLKGEGRDMSFIGAHNICMWSFQRHNLVKKNFGISSRGQVREKYHKTKKDKGAGQKTKKYESMFNKVFKKSKR